MMQQTPQLKLCFLGPPQLDLAGEIVEPDTRKATAMLAYLAVVAERPSRDWLAAFLWPEFDDRRAKAALRRTLSALRSTVGETAVYATRESIGLELEQVWCDVTEFRQLLEQGECDKAAHLYRDDFMSGFSLRDSIPFDDWQMQQAEDLRRELAGALEQLALNAGAHHDFDKGITYARRWLQLDPLREEAHCQLMRLNAWSGQRSAALLQYRECVRILDEELGVSPLPETTSLYHDIQHDRPAKPVVSLPPKGEYEMVTEPVAVSPIPPIIGSAAIPLIGRQVTLEKMQQFYEQVGPDGRLLIVEGEPGIGKSRLAETLLAWARAAGAVTLDARCYEGETSLAYAPIIQVLRDRLGAVNAAWVDALPARHIAEAARLLPQLADGRSLPALPTLGAPGAQVRFYDGIVHVLTAMLSGSRPGILWLDDVHWLDLASQELLLYLLRRWQKRPFLVLLCWQAEELLPGHLLSTLVAELRRAAVSETIRLTRFTAAQVQDLLTAAGITFQPDLPARLYEETEGLPFFVVEYLNVLVQQDGMLKPAAILPTPASVRDLLHNRLTHITETERQILQAAAAIGHGFDLELVQAASGRSAEESLTSLETLASRGLVVEQAAVYDFSHDKLRALVYDEMGLARRRLLHRRLAETLAKWRAMPTMAVSAQIANHFQLAGLEAKAAAYFVQAGDQARALFAHQDAIHYYRSALALGAADAWRLHAACGELYTRLAAYPDAVSVYETAAALSPAAELGPIEHKLAQVHQRQGNWILAAHMLTQAQEHLAETADSATLARLTIDRSLVAHRLERPAEALALAQQARVLAETAGDPATLALAYNLLGLLARGQGELEEAAALLERSCRLADNSDRLDIQIAARNNLALTLSAAGQLDVARTNLEQALALCQRLGDRHHEAALRSNLADVLHHAGEENAAQEQIRQSVTIYADIGRQGEEWQAEIWRLMEW